MANRSYTSALQNKGSFLRQRGVGDPWVQPTGRIDAARAAEILGFQEHDLPILVNCRLLEPLANPVTNAKKYFAAVHVLELAENPDWLSKATQAVYDHWQAKNGKREKPEHRTQTD